VGPNEAIKRGQIKLTEPTWLYSGEIPIEQVKAAFSKKGSVAQLENMENGAAA
jgi:hypothetical protein